MSNKSLKFPLAEQSVYPHLKITRERFPRLFATRKFIDPKDEYFGAYLTKTALRIWLYHLNRIFRLRTCQIEITGDFAQPCQMFYSKKCVAPCVKNLCSESEYAANVRALRLFLSGDEKEYERFIVAKIDEFAENLEFEKAARWRDVWRASQALKADKKTAISLANAVDTYSFETIDGKMIFHLVTTRGRKFLGNQEFVFPASEAFDQETAVAAIIDNFYRFHAPREIRVPFDFAARKTIEKLLRESLNVQTKITVIKNDLNTTAKMRLIRTKVEYDLGRLGGDLSAAQISAMIQVNFQLKRRPRLIEAFDVAHLANEDFITANAVWENGELQRERAQHWKTDAGNEPQAMARAVRERLDSAAAPDLILIDGGRAQLNAVLNEIDARLLQKTAFVSAVKPPGKHGEISHFLLASGERVEFAAGERIYELLRNLRDEAHRTANELHRRHRDNKYIFAARQGESARAADVPLVPIRFDEPGGAAEDLQPIKTVL